MTRLILLLLIIFPGCTQKPDKSSDINISSEAQDISSRPTIYSTSDYSTNSLLPKKIKLNLNDGYAVDPLTGDSLLPSINSIGDTVATGEQIKMSGKVFDKSSFFTSNAVRVINPKVFPAHSNMHHIPKNLTLKTVVTHSIKSSKTNLSSLQTLLNSVGDTIITNTPIKIKGETFSIDKSNSNMALKPSVRENAIEDIEFYNLEHGMSSPYVQDMIQDRQGHIWIATYGGGVNEFNGNEFIYFSKEEGLMSNVIMSLMEDSKGNIWLGTLYNGLIRYDGNNFTRFSEKDGLSNNSIFSMVERSDGSIWFGTMGSGIIKYENQKFTNYTINEGLQGLTINTLIEDINRNLLIGSEEFGFCIYNDESFIQYSTNEGLLNKEVTSLLEDKNGYIWIGTRSHGLFRLKDEYFVHYSVNEGLSSNNISSLLEDKKGNIWIATLDKGINKYSGDTFKHFTTNEGLKSNKIQSIMEDSYGNLWFGTYNGVHKYNPNSFNHFSKKEGFSEKSARSIYEANNGDIWFGTNGRGVIKYDGINFTHFGEKEGFCKNGSDVWSIEEDKNGNFWFATIPDGIFKYDGSYFTSLKCKKPFFNQVIAFQEDINGNFWLAYDSRGIGHFNGEYFIHFTDEKGLLHNDIYSIFEDSQGNLWINSRGGGVSKISIMKDASSIDSSYIITHYSGKEGFTSSTISEIMEDSEGNMWFGTQGYGLIKFDGMSFTYYNEQDGISTNGIISMIEDRDGRIWVGTSDGLECLLPNPDSLENLNSIEDEGLSQFQVRSFGTMDGLKARNFQNSSLVDKNNRIWWSIGSGLTMLDLNTFEFSETKPRLQLSQLKINDQLIDYRNDEEISKLNLKFDSVPKFYNYPINLIIPYFNNQLTFLFSAMDGTSSHNIKYSFKMDGLEDNWSHPSSESKIEYKNLPYGDFTLKVKAIGAARKWSETFEYTFVIQPPWWHTWWARTIYGLLFVLLMLGIIRIRTNILLNQRKHLRNEVEKRTLELKNAQAQLIQSEKMASLGQLTAGIAHEINNPVSFTQTSSFALDQDLKDITLLIDKYRSYIQNRKDNVTEIEDFEKSIDYKFLIEAINQSISDIKEGTKRTSDIVKGLREFSHVDQEEMALADIHHGMDSTLNLLKSKFIGNIKLIKNYDQSIGMVNCHIGQLNQVFMNLIINAIDAIEEKGEIVITTKNQGDNVSILIEDNGHGIPEELINKIFDPFFTTKQVGEGMGLGLSISHGIIKNHGGTISVTSSPGKGTRFDIVLPRG